MPKTTREQKNVKPTKKNTKVPATIASNNAAFAAATKAEKRVIIARDVLAQVKRGKILPTAGTWLDADVSVQDAKKNRLLTEVIENQKSCQACAVGSMFVCALSRGKPITLKDVIDNDSNDSFEEDYSSRAARVIDLVSDEGYLFEYLGKYFTSTQLALIEAAFERRDYEYDAHGIAAEEFAAGVDDAAERLRLIMENIIVNNGTFKPHKKPVFGVATTPGFVG